MSAEEEAELEYKAAKSGNDIKAKLHAQLSREKWDKINALKWVLGN